MSDPGPALAIFSIAFFIGCIGGIIYYLKYDRHSHKQKDTLDNDIDKLINELP